MPASVGSSFPTMVSIRCITASTRYTMAELRQLRYDTVQPYWNPVHNGRTRCEHGLGSVYHGIDTVDHSTLRYEHGTYTVYHGKTRCEHCRATVVPVEICTVGDGASFLRRDLTRCTITVTGDIGFNARITYRLEYDIKEAADH